MSSIGGLYWRSISDRRAPAVLQFVRQTLSAPSRPIVRCSRCAARYRARCRRTSSLRAIRAEKIKQFLNCSFITCSNNFSVLKIIIFGIFFRQKSSSIIKQARLIKYSLLRTGCGLQSNRRPELGRCASRQQAQRIECDQESGWSDMGSKRSHDVLGLSIVGPTGRQAVRFMANLKRRDPEPGTDAAQ